MSLVYDEAAMKKTKCNNQRESLSPFFSALDRLKRAIVLEQLRKLKVKHP